MSTPQNGLAETFPTTTHNASLMKIIYKLSLSTYISVSPGYNIYSKKCPGDIAIQERQISFSLVLRGQKINDNKNSNSKVL